MKNLTTLSDVRKLIRSNDIVVVNVYRGDWCPFCRRYLKAMDRIFANQDNYNVSLFGLSVDSVVANQKLQSTLQLNYTLTSDSSGLFREQFANPVSTKHFQSTCTANGFFLQPAVYVFSNGELAYKWHHESSILNLAGAIGRLPVEEIVQQVRKVQLHDNALA